MNGGIYSVRYRFAWEVRHLAGAGTFKHTSEESCGYLGRACTPGFGPFRGSTSRCDP